jgi:hypothetical protein
VSEGPPGTKICWNCGKPFALPSAAEPYLSRMRGHWIDARMKEAQQSRDFDDYKALRRLRGEFREGDAQDYRASGICLNCVTKLWESHERGAWPP